METNLNFSPAPEGSPVLSAPPETQKLPKITLSRKILLGAVFIILILFSSYFLFRKIPANVEYGDVFRLVPEKISQSASIRISLPEGADKEVAKKGVSFDPKIEGSWIGETLLPDQPLSFLSIKKVSAALIGQRVNANFIVFKPKSELALNRHYSVTADLGEGKILASDFLAVENPNVTAIFPKSDSESPEDSKITIAFNRPMVPLTTLEELESQNIPVDILPKTEGKFKWISTNTLQFIPKETLRASSNYTVKIRQGFVSMDGLSVAGFESGFQTRNLRYGDGENYSKLNQQVYNEPVRIYFNQPVDLEKTKAEIKLTDKNANKDIPFVAQYGKRDSEDLKPQYKQGDSMGIDLIKSTYASILDFFKGAAGSQEDQSVIEIYPEKDRFGRPRFWDFNNNYKVSINKAYPIEGDINLNQSKIIDITSTDITSFWAAVSEKTGQARLDLFDPSGYLSVGFFESINLSKSVIKGDRFDRVEYGQKCKDDQAYSFESCEKVEDRTKIKIYFQANSINPGDRLSVRLEKIINDEGIQINKDTVLRQLVVFSPLKLSLGDLSKTHYARENYLKGFYICSNNPLQIPEKKDYKNAIKANLDYQINYINPSYLMSGHTGEPCPISFFATWVSGGFMPNSNYQVNLDFNDVFLQNAKNNINFTTGSITKNDVDIFALQQTYSITTPDKTTLTFGSLNINYVDVLICKVSALGLKNAYSANSSGNCLESKSKAIVLPEKYWINNYFDINLADYFSVTTGNYVIELSHPLLTNYEGSKRFEKSYVTVTNLAVAEKSIAPATEYLGVDGEMLTQGQMQSLKNLYWVTDIKTQNPVAGAEIKFYGKGGNLLGSAATDESGVAFSAPEVGVDSIVASLGSDSTVIMRSDMLAWASSAENYRKAYIYTDKPLYRPEQTVHVKGILRIGYDGNYEMFNNSTVKITGRNSKGDSILDKDVSINDFGTFDFDFVLPKESPLGTYRICLGKSYMNCSSFDILEYVPAAFEVKSMPSKQEYISKETVEVDVNANYYFGAPVESAELDYVFSSQNYYFDKYDGNEWFSFGWWDDYYYERGGYYYGDRFILRGSGRTDENGKFKISQKVDLQEMFKNSQNQGSKIMVLDTTVKNSLGQSVSSQQSFIVHAGQYYIGVRTDPYFVGKNQEFNLKIKTIDKDGKNLSAGNLTADIYRVDWIFSKRQEAGGVFNYKWEKKTDLVKSIKLSTDQSGSWSQKIKLDKEGEYEIQVSGTDRLGNLIKSKQNVYVYGSGQASFRPINDTTLTLKSGNTNLKAGEQGELIIESPYPKSKALISIERGKIFDYEIVDFNGNIQGYKFTAKEEYAPNVFVSVLLQSSDPAVKFGMKEFKINSDKSKINIEVKSDKKFYSPGDQVKLDIFASDSSGKPLKTEASIAVVDLSVLALKGNEKKNPLVFFYNGFPLTVSTSSNIKNGIVKVEITDRNSKGGSGGGSEDEGKARGEFKETAFWQAKAVTGNDGRTQVTFKLPDNLTTWQAEVLGVTKDTKLGVGYLDFMSKKELMVIPLKPRFIIPGDTFYIGGEVFNQSSKDKNLKVLFKSETLELLSPNAEKNITIKKGQSQSVFFEVKAPQQVSKGTHVFTLSANGGEINDAVTQTVPIKPNLTYEVTATANYTQGEGSREVIYLPSNVSTEAGELSMRTSATLAVFLSDALNYLIAYPYGCSEQISSRLKAIAIIKAGLKIPNLADKFKLEKIQYGDKEYTVDEIVEIGLADLYKNQNYDGGFSFWGQSRSDYYATLTVVDALLSLKKADYAVSTTSLNKGSDYLYRYYNENRSKMSENDVISLASVLVKSEGYSGNNNLTQAVLTIANNSYYLQDKLSAKSLAELGVLLNRISSSYFTLIKVNNALDNKINIDSRGAFLEPKKGNYYYNYFESVVGNTALYLDSLAVGKRDTAITDKVIRWLLNSRQKDGAWGSTQNTLSVVQAFTDYLNWKKETSAVYTLETKLNAKTIDTYSVNASTILNQNRKTLPISDFKINDYNYLELSKKGSGSVYYDMGLKYYLSGIVQPRDEGFTITREFYAIDDKDGLAPLSKAKAGDIIREHLTIVAPVQRKYVQIEDYIPAGMEIVDLSLATESKLLRFSESQVKNPEIYPDFKEIRDDRAFIFTNELQPGAYEFDYYLRALVPGDYLQLPAVVSEMYTPENFGRTASQYFKVIQ